MPSHRQPRVVITGGGTAGHVFPALAVARALVTLGYERSGIHFVGSRRGIEGTTVTEAGFAILLLRGRGIVRRLAFSNVAAVGAIVVGFLRSLAFLLHVRPSVVVSVGGYASIPCALAARCCAIPVVVVNVDAAPGLANRIVARVAVASAVAFFETDLPRAVVTGAPIREEIARMTRDEVSRAQARQRLDLPAQGVVIALVGGSLGARRLNELGLDLARALHARDDVFIYHVVGPRNIDAIERALVDRPVGTHYRAVAFCDDMATLLGACDLFVSRSGAMTVAELAATGTPAILFPLPSAPRDHQRKNAEVLAAAGGALVLSEDQLAPEELVATVGALIDDQSRREQMGRAARSLARPGAAKAIAGLIDNVVCRPAMRVDELRSLRLDDPKDG